MNYKFRCVYCGKKVTDTEREIVHDPGVPGGSGIPVCKNCKKAASKMIVRTKKKEKEK